MDPADGRAALALVDAVSIWRLSDGPVSDVIDAATDCLVEGLDTPTLRILAGEPAWQPLFVLEPMIEDTLRELGLEEVLRGDGQRAALKAMLRRFKTGKVSARDLARWAHGHIGHQGDADCQVFVVLDDWWGELGSTNASEAELEAWTAREADAFLAGRPSPGRNGD
jgi:hypothetical protein